MRIHHLLLLATITLLPARGFPIARSGSATCVIPHQDGLTSAETNAREALVSTLQAVTGAAIPQVDPGSGKAEILVGAGSLARTRFPDIPFDTLGPEELVIRVRANTLLLAGGRPRGTLYAVSRFLQSKCGVRWWTPWAARIPRQATLEIPDLDVRERPAFEYRESFWYPAFDCDWSWRNRVNGHSSRLTPEFGGAVHYKGFVHTFYPLVPPETHFATHPEWFSLIKGKRTTDRAQLCLTNPRLREFVVQRVKEWLRESPDVGIVSVSQNDWYGACECDACKAVDDAEGSHAGTLIQFVNQVAEAIEPEFPHVAVDTLAYQYTRKPPRTARPRQNVIVRLCSIECNFREPLDHPSNAAFADDIRGWAAICRRLYIWDYTTDFAHYVQPHPNWFTLGPNLRFFHAHNVRGVFEQGAYQSHGSEFAELRAWVLAQLLWRPQQDDRALIREFLDGYYGPAAEPIRRHLDLMHKASHGHNLTCFSRTDVPFLRFKPLAESERLWGEAERAAAGQPEFLERVRLARRPSGYVWLARWDALRKECADTGGQWPLPESIRDFAESWRQAAAGTPGKPWTTITLVNEAGLTPEKFLARILEPTNNPTPRTR